MIEQIRKKYPQYSDLSDKQLADALYKKFYSDIDRAQFDEKIGIGAQEQQQTKPTISKSARLAGRAGRNIVAGSAAAIDTALLVPKTLSLGAGLGLDAMGMEGNVSQFLKQVGTNPGLRESALQAVDTATNNQLQPQGFIDRAGDFVSEMLVPTGAISKFSPLAQKVTTAPVHQAATKTGNMAKKAVKQGQIASPVAMPQAMPAQAGKQIRLSRGQATQAPDIQEFEDLARTGVKGAAAQELAIKFDVQQQGDVVKTFSRLLDDVESPKGLTDATETVVDVIKTKRSQLKGIVDKAYQKARGQSGGVKFDTAVIRSDFVDLAKNTLDENGLTPNKTTLPVTNELFRQLKTSTGKNNIAVKLDAMERWRTAVTAQADSLKGTAEGNALNILKRQYDEFMTGMADQAIKESDSGAIKSFRKARALRARLGKIYEQDKIIDRLSSGEGGTVESMVSDIFGAANFNTKRNAALTVQAIKTAARGQEQQVSQLMKQGVVSRMLDSAKSDRLIPGTDLNMISMGKLKTQLDNVLDGNASLAGEIFSPDDLKVLRDLQKDLSFVKSQQPGTVNYSGSGTRVLKALSQLGGFASKFPGGELVSTLATPVKTAANTSKAKTAFAEPQKVLAQAARQLKIESSKQKIAPFIAGAGVTALNQQQPSGSNNQ